MFQVHQSPTRCATFRRFPVSLLFISLRFSPLVYR